MPKRKPPPKTMGQKICEAREKAGLTQAEVAYNTGLILGAGDIGYIEREDWHVKGYVVIKAVRDVLGMK